MEKSIESIWNEGFMDNEKLIIPKVVDLYNRKSQLLIDKMMRTMKMDLYSIIPVTIGFGTWAYFQENLLFGLLLISLIGVAFGLSLWQYKKFHSIDTTIDSYRYLIEFKQTLSKVFSFFTKFFAFAYPILAFPVFYILYKDTDWAMELAQQPLPLIIFACFGGLVFLGLSGVVAYRLAVFFVYGRMTKKLKEIISDMEELKN